MKRKGKILGAFILTLCLVVTMIPLAAFGDELTPETDVSQEQSLETEGTEPDGVGQPQEDPALQEGLIEPSMMMLLNCPDHQTNPTTIEVYYREKDNGTNADNINIDNNPLVIPVPDSYFDGRNTATYNLTEYVPEYIWDKDGFVWEINDRGGGQQRERTITKGLTNKFYYHYKSMNQEGTITIKKMLAGDQNPPRETFTFRITGPYQYTNVVTITGASQEKITKLPQGTYQIEEILIPENFKIDNRDNMTQSAIISHQKDKTVTFKNCYTKPQQTHGSLEISKVIKDSADSVTFAFDVYFDEVKVTEAAVTIENSTASSVVIPDLTPGAYTIYEHSNNAYEPDIDSNRLDSEAYAKSSTVTAGTTALVIFYNKLKEVVPTPTAITVTKSVATFNGETMPEVFRDRVDLSQESRVLFKIVISTDVERMKLIDLYNGSNVTGQLYQYNNEDWVQVALQDSGELYVGPQVVLYYSVRVTTPGTYTNIAELQNIYGVPITSDSAVVTLTGTDPEDPGDDDPPYNPPSRSHHYVTYAANYPTTGGVSGAVPSDSKSYSDGNTVTVKDNTSNLAVTGYAFNGWDLKADGSGTDYLPGSSFKIYNNVTLYAQWKPVEETTPTNTSTNPSEPNQSVTANSNDLDDVPKTGDNTPLVPIAILGILSLGVLVGTARRRVF